MHAAGADTDRLTPDTTHPDPDTANDTTPVPEPPPLVNVTGVPATPDTTAFDTTSEAWDAAVNVNTTGLLDTGPNTPDAAFDAVTVHAAGAVAFNDAPASVHPDPATANDTTPEPDPPLVVNTTAVPAGPDLDTFDTTNDACGPTIENTTGALDTVR